MRLKTGGNSVPEFRPAPALALATFFVAVQFYTSLQALSPTPQVGFSFLNRAGAGVLAATLVVCALTCAAALARDGGFARPWPSGAMLSAWILGALVSALLGLAPLEGLQLVAMMLLAALFHVALVRWYRDPQIARAVVLAYLAEGTLAAASGIVMVWAHVPLALYAETHGRAAGFFVSANQFAEFLDLFVFVALGIGLGAREAWLRRAGVAGAAIGLGALALTFSREGWSGAAVASIWLAAALRRRRLAFALGAALLLAIAALWLRPFPRHDPSDTFSRLRTLESGLRAVELFPLTGVGPVEYWRIYPAIRPVNGPAPGTFGALHPHDVYLSLAGETGLVGLGAAVFGWLCFARALRLRLRRAPAPQRRFALAICAGFVAIFFAGLFDSIGVVQMTFGALHPHDVYLSLAGETGLVGLGAAVFGWLCFARALRRRLRRAPAPQRRSALAICAGFVAIFFAGLFDSIGIVQMTFVWIPYTALALAVAADGPPSAERRV